MRARRRSSSDLPGTRWVVGDGPARMGLQRRHRDAQFFGMRHGRELAAFYQQADVLVFPSKTDTFGLVMVEAMACGTPVAAFPVPGPLDVVEDPRAGVLDTDLRRAALGALDLNRDEVAAYASRYSWRSATEAFVSNLVPGGTTTQASRSSRS